MVKQTIRDILDYLENNKQKQKDSIYEKVKKVRDWLDSPSCPLVDEEELEDD